MLASWKRSLQGAFRNCNRELRLKWEVKHENWGNMPNALGT